MYKRHDAAINQELLHRVAGVFRTSGFAGASLSAIAASTGLSKASLYHHFPRGKQQMAEALVEQAIAQSEKLMFSRLKGDAPALDRLSLMLDGYMEHTSNGEHPCLLTSLGPSAPEPLKSRIREQFKEWQMRLESALCELRSVKPKRAARLAEETFCGLYGATTLAGLVSDPAVAQRAIKRLRKNFEASA